jgi:DNA adenine methylase
MPESIVERPVLRYHGGKWLLANWIISNFPEHRVYTEVFGGAASVLIQKRRSYAEVYNDKWNTVVNVFKVLRDPIAAQELERQIRLTPFSRHEFNQCGEIDLINIDDPIELARRTILRSFAGFGPASTNAKHSTGFRSNSNRYGTTPAHDWVNYPDQIKLFTERLKGVVIENRDYDEVLRNFDSPDTLHFLDPPYVHDTRNMQRGNAAYVHELTDDDHIKMAVVVEQLIGMVIICGYESDLYKELFGHWIMVRRESYADGAAKRVECLWLNKNCKTSQLKIFHP